MAPSPTEGNDQPPPFASSWAWWHWFYQSVGCLLCQWSRLILLWCQGFKPVLHLDVGGSEVKHCLLLGSTLQGILFFPVLWYLLQLILLAVLKASVCIMSMKSSCSEMLLNPASPSCIWILTSLTWVLTCYQLASLTLETLPYLAVLSQTPYKTRLGPRLSSSPGV